MATHAAPLRAPSSAMNTQHKILYGTKIGMTRVFDGDIVVPVTVIQVLPNEVVEIKTAEKHGHAALKVAVGPKRRKPTKPLAGEFKKADVAPRRFMREVPVSRPEPKPRSARRSPSPPSIRPSWSTSSASSRAAGSRAS